MNWRATVTVLVIAVLALGTYAWVNRYEVRIGGGTRYYSVIKLDRWTGQAWRLDNRGTHWNRIEPAEAR